MYKINGLIRNTIFCLHILDWLFDFKYVLHVIMFSFQLFSVLKVSVTANCQTAAHWILVRPAQALIVATVTKAVRLFLSRALVLEHGMMIPRFYALVCIYQ